MLVNIFAHIYMKLIPQQFEQAVLSLFQKKENGGMISAKYWLKTISYKMAHTL